jgi:hypothetical protein
MSWFSHKHGRGLLVSLAIVAIAVSACGSSSGTKAPDSPASGAPNTTVAPGGGSGLAGAATAFSSLKSYKFSMTLAGGSFGSMLSVLGGASASAGAGFTVKGTVLVADKAADVDVMGMHMIEVGGFSYLDMGGSFAKTPSNGDSLADSFSPAKIFSSSIGSTADGYSKVGTESKNGVQADHFKAADSTLSGMGSVLGVGNATWTSDVWIAVDGGYPVSMAMVATLSDKSIGYEVLFDISNINDPANTVTAPTNLFGS